MFAEEGCPQQYRAPGFCLFARSFAVRPQTGWREEHWQGLAGCEAKGEDWSRVGLTCCGAEEGETHGGVGGGIKRVQGDSRVREDPFFILLRMHQYRSRARFLLARLRASWLEG